MHAELPLLTVEPNMYVAVRKEIGIFRAISARILSHAEICPKVSSKKKKKKITGCDLCCKKLQGPSILSQ